MSYICLWLPAFVGALDLEAQMLPHVWPAVHSLLPVKKQRLTGKCCDCYCHPLRLDFQLRACVNVCVLWDSQASSYPRHHVGLRLVASKEQRMNVGNTTWAIVLLSHRAPENSVHDPIKDVLGTFMEDPGSKGPRRSLYMFWTRFSWLLPLQAS